jgi:hypothetical protein
MFSSRHGLSKQQPQEKKLSLNLADKMGDIPEYGLVDSFERFFCMKNCTSESKEDAITKHRCTPDIPQKGKFNYFNNV